MSRANPLINAGLERELVACLVTLPEAVSLVHDGFSADDISDHDLRAVCAAVLCRESTDPTSLVAHLRATHGARRVRIWDNLIADLLADGRANEAFAKHQSRQLHDLAAIRNAQEELRKSQAKLVGLDYTTTGTVSKFLNTLSKELGEIGGERTTGGELVIVRADEVEPQAVDWLWPNRIPKGRVSMVIGDPGLGKSLFGISAAATVTRGSTWPDGATASAPRSVVLLMAEDDAGDTVRPRLDAAGADVGRVHIVQGTRTKGRKGLGSERQFSLQDDLPALAEVLKRNGDVDLLVLDPVNAYLGRCIDSHKDAEVRSVLGPLGELARQHSVAVVGVMHLNKSSASKAAYRAIGSIAYVAAARAVWMVAKDPQDEGRRLFLPVKMNIAPEPRGLAFRVEESVPGGAPFLQWERGEVQETADEVLARSASKASQPRRQEVGEWLLDLLSEGPVPAKEVFEQGGGHGFSEKTIRRAARSVGIENRTDGFQGPSMWGLSGSRQPNGGPKVPHSNGWPPLEDDGQDWADGPSGNDGQGTFGSERQEAKGAKDGHAEDAGPWGASLDPVFPDTGHPVVLRRLDEADVYETRDGERVRFSALTLEGNDLWVTPSLQRVRIVEEGEDWA